MLNIPKETLVFDIETSRKDTSISGVNPDNSKLEMFGAYSYLDNQYHFTDNLYEIQRLIGKHKYLVGFNTIGYYKDKRPGFDVPVLKNHGIDFQYKIHVDCYSVLKKRAEGMMGFTKDKAFPSYKLKVIAECLGLKTGKGDFDFLKLEQPNWKQDKEIMKDLLKYLKKDVQVTKEMYEYLENFFNSFKDYLSTDSIKKKHYLTTSSSSYAYKAICNLSGIKEEYSKLDDEKISYEGGYVANPLKEEEHDNCYAIDITSSYPHAFMMFNLFGRIKNGYCSICGGVCKNPFKANKLFPKLRGEYCGVKPHKITKALKKLFLNRLMHKAKGDPKHKAEKLILNSTYGAVASPVFKNIYDRIAAEDCTYIGRTFIKYTRSVYEKFNYPLLYSDSVGKNSLIYTNSGNNKISKLFKNVDETIGEKEYYYPKNLSVLSGNLKTELNSLNKVKYIMRHKISKPMYRVWLNGFEYIEVTEDHSLIGFLNTKKRKNKKYINVAINDLKSKKVSTLIRCGYLERKNIQGNVFNTNINSYEMMGYFLGDGCFSHSHNKLLYLGLSLGLDYNELSKRVNKLKINNFWDKGKGDIGFGYTSPFSKLLINKMYDNKKKKIPKELFDADEKYICAFIRGYFSADGTVINRGGSSIIRVTSINANYLKQIKILLLYIGISSYIIKESKRSVFKTKYRNYVGGYSHHLIINNNNKYSKKIGFILDRKNKKIIKTKTKNQFIKNDFHLVSFKKIEKINYNDYVYDICVNKNHTFYANNILCHNTDSIYLKDPFNDKQKILTLKDFAIKHIKQYVPFPQNTFDFELEKEIKHIFFFKDENDPSKKKFLKKNYIYVTNNNDIKIMGLPIVKRNATELSRMILKNYLEDEIMDGICKFDKEYLKSIIQHEIKKNPSILGVTFTVKDDSFYINKNDIRAQISRKYGVGKHVLIRNNSLGVGISKKYCTLLQAKKLSSTSFDLSTVWNELKPFIKEKYKQLTMGDF